MVLVHLVFSDSEDNDKIHYEVSRDDTVGKCTLHGKFDLIPIKLIFCDFKCGAIKSVTSVLYVWPGPLVKFCKKMKRREFLIFIIFPDTYTCSYVA